MSRTTHDRAARRGQSVAPIPHARPLSSFTPEQQRLLRALIEAARTTPVSRSLQAPQPPTGGGAR